MGEPRIQKVKGGVRSALVDPAVRDRLQAAATHAGFSGIEELVNLVVDGGFVALVPDDGVTEKYSLEDLGVQMHTQMPPTDRPEWFSNLVETQQIALVVMLRSRGYASQVIGRDFGISELEVGKLYTRYADDLGAQVINVRLNTLVGNLQLASERASQGSMEKEDWGTYWRIQKEMIALLQSLGIVKRAIQKVEVAHHFDDQKGAELEALLELERKQAARREEIKRADFEVLDPVPPILLSKAPGSMQEHFDDA